MAHILCDQTYCTSDFSYIFRPDIRLLAINCFSNILASKLNLNNFLYIVDRALLLKESNTVLIKKGQGHPSLLT